MTQMPAFRVLVVGCILLIAGAAVAQEYEGGYEPGMLPPPGLPFDITLEVTTDADGMPMLSRDEFVLARGGYYRLNFTCSGGDGEFSPLHLEAPDLLADSHIRILNVQDMEFFVQGMTFRAIECDEPNSASFSFHPLRSGVYDVQVHNQDDPSQVAHARIVVE